jgi:hypothetical protein
VPNEAPTAAGNRARCEIDDAEVSESSTKTEGVDVIITDGLTSVSWVVG